MKEIVLVICSTLPFLALSVNVHAVDTQTFSTSAGPVKITPLNHASTLIEAGGKAIYLDPAKPAKLGGLPKADLILITDIHGDHMDPDSIKEISKSDTEIISLAGSCPDRHGRQAHRERGDEELAELDHRGHPRLQPETRSCAWQAFSRQGPRQRIRPHLRRQALLFFRRHRRRARDARAQEH